MKLYSKKHTNASITVASKRNKIITKKGFVVITKGTHYGHETIRPDLLEEYYSIPENVTFKD